MEHRLARRVVDAISGATGLGRRAEALLLTALLPDTRLSPESSDRCLERALALPADPNLTGADYTLDGAPGSDRADFLRRFGRVLTDYSRRPAEHLEMLFLLGELWGHCNRREQSSLLLLWLDHVHGGHGEDDAFITREDLKRWQRNQLTTNDATPLSPGALQGMFEEETPAGAYAVLAEYLGFDTRPAELCWTLGTLTLRVLLHTFDLDGRMLAHYAGAACAWRLAPASPPEVMIVAISQLNHAIWWAYRRRSRRRLTHFPERETEDLASAILAGDIILAEALARRRCADLTTFWNAIEKVFATVLAEDDELWVRALRAVVAVHLRCEQDAPTPDDGAALAAALATVRFQQAGAG